MKVKYDDNEFSVIIRKRIKKIKRFIKNLFLAKYRIHFDVWAGKCWDSFISSAKNITATCFIGSNAIKNKNNIRNSNNKKYANVKECININSYFIKPGYIYIRFFKDIPKNVVIASGEVSIVHKCCYLHELVDLTELGIDCRHINLQFSDNTNINQIFIFSKGILPNWVQQWKPPFDKCDIMFMSTHSDDEHLFFAGILPLNIANGKKVQMLYYAPPIVGHRMSELLDGLWHIGIKQYPVLGPFYDEYSATESEAIQNLEKRDLHVDDIRSFIVTNLRKHKPDIVVSQDIYGEYGHGQHILFSKELLKSVPLSSDPNYDEKSFNQYGCYHISKVYHHLYNKNKVNVDIDTRIKELNGKTPYRLSQEAFSFHRSQYISFFPSHLFGTIVHPIKKSTDVKKFSPGEWGLSYSIVGQDIKKDDFFEGLK